MMASVTFNFDVAVEPEEKITFTFRLSPAEASDLAARIEPALTGSEVRLTLAPHASGNWVFFWRLRESDCRALFAHPEKEDWVATVSLEQKVLAAAVAKLRAAETFGLHSLCTLGGFSNLRLEFVVA